MKKNVEIEDALNILCEIFYGDKCYKGIKQFEEDLKEIEHLVNIIPDAAFLNNSEIDTKEELKSMLIGNLECNYFIKVQEEFGEALEEYCEVKEDVKD